MSLTNKEKAEIENYLQHMEISLIQLDLDIELEKSKIRAMHELREKKVRDIRKYKKIAHIGIEAYEIDELKKAYGIGRKTVK